MQFLRGNIDDFEVEKDHFQKSDIFAMWKRGVLREITSSARRNHIAPWDPSENHTMPLGNVMFSKMCLWLRIFYEFQLAKPGKFMHF